MGSELLWETCPACGAKGKIDDEQLSGVVSIICSDCGHHYNKREKKCR